MPDTAADFTLIVPHFLPFNEKTPDSLIDELSEADLITTTVACFALAARHQLPKMNEAQRQSFCGDLVGQCETNPQVWMVEASLRATETDNADFIVGIPGDVLAEIQLVGLGMLSNEYLTKAECEALHGPAAEYARHLQPLITAGRAQASRGEEGPSQ